MTQKQGIVLQTVIITGLAIVGIFVWANTYENVKERFFTKTEQFEIYTTEYFPTTSACNIYFTHKELNDSFKFVMVRAGLMFSYVPTRMIKQITYYNISRDDCTNATVTTIKDINKP